MRALLSVWLFALLLGCEAPGSTSGRGALETALSTCGTETVLGAPGVLPRHGAGRHRDVMSLRILIGDEGTGLSLLLERIVDRDAGGSFKSTDSRVVRTPWWAGRVLEEGREGIHIADTFATRRTGAPWIMREVLEGEPWTWLQDTYDIAPTLRKAFGGYFVWTEASPPTSERLFGMEVTWSRISLDEGVAPAPLDQRTLDLLRDHETHWAAWLAATHRPERVQGRLARATTTGEVVAGDLDIVGTVTIDQEERRFELELRYGVESLPEDVSFRIPEGAYPTERPRIWRMVEGVMGEDLAPIYHRAAGGAAPSP